MFLPDWARSKLFCIPLLVWNPPNPLVLLTLPPTPNSEGNLMQPDDQQSEPKVESKKRDPVDGGVGNVVSRHSRKQRKSKGPRQEAWVNLKAILDTCVWLMIGKKWPMLCPSKHSVQFSCSVLSDSLQPHRLPHARLPCPSSTPGAYSNPCPLSQWYHLTISSSFVPFSSHLQSFPASGSFLMSQFFTSGGQSIGVSASTSVQILGKELTICWLWALVVNVIMSSILKKSTVHMLGNIMEPIVSWIIQGGLPPKGGSQTSPKS